MLSEKILNYVDHLESAEYWAALHRDYPGAEIEAAMVSLLDRGSSGEVSSTCLFIRGLLLRGFARGNPAFDFKSKALVQALERQVRSAAVSSRNEAIYTLGKIGAKESLEFLREVLISTKDADPMMVPRLAFEIRWLSEGSELAWLAENALASPSYLTRWAGVGVLDDYGVKPGEPEWKEKREALEVASGDGHARVSGGAAFLLEEMGFGEELPRIETRAEKKRRHKELERRRPMNFDGVANRFWNELGRRSAESYTVVELAEFAESLGGR